MKKLATFAAMLVLGLTAACGDQGVVAPDSQRAPRVEQVSYSTSVEEDLKNILSGRMPDFTVRENSAVIGSAGGFLYVSGHYLYVPAGAVEGPTTFHMKLAPGNQIGAELTAVDGQGNDVGRDGFNKPLTLALTYAYATNVPSDPRQMAIGWVRDDGTIEPQPTQIFPMIKLAIGQLDHFSKYVLATPW